MFAPRSEGPPLNSGYSNRNHVILYDKYTQKIKKRGCTLNQKWGFEIEIELAPQYLVCPPFALVTAQILLVIEKSALYGGQSSD